MKKFLLIAGGIVAVCAAILFFLWPKGPDLSKYDWLKDPQINKIERQKVITVTLTGDPEKISNQGIAALFKMYYRLKEVDKAVMAIPKARWTGAVDTPKDRWSAEFAIRVPEEVNALPEQKEGLKVELKYWEYGETAEILHIGPYSDELADIGRLTALAKDKNYLLSGRHEEEYLKGPGMFFKGDPKNYKTIIRYTLTKGIVIKHQPAKAVLKKSTKTSVKKGKK